VDRHPLPADGQESAEGKLPGPGGQGVERPGRGRVRQDERREVRHDRHAGEEGEGVDDAAEHDQDGHAGTTESDPIEEQKFVVDTIDQLEQSPEWSSTAVVIAYDMRES